MDIKVRVGETDALGHINNTSYFIYMEETRIEFLSEIGIRVHDQDFAFMLASTKCDFSKQGYFGQTLEVLTEVAKIGTKSITLLSTIEDKESGDVIAKGEAVIVYFDVRMQQSIKIPESFKTKLGAHLRSA
ncbi:acyl-CoA thioesterase [Virgibacillus byunsanensis]|uniref:Acyl-CoA thioesterase n=1 Tax=Virgibacillus byunsanensis TaxID=570945 RepID=A0ABW3LPY1_9BACI